MNEHEKAHLERISQDSLYAAGLSGESIRYSFKIACRSLVGETLLELGPAEGVMTEMLVTTGKKITVVEGSASFCEDLQRRFPQIQVDNALFEEYETDRQFDNIIMGHVLEHVQDPVAILRRALAWLKPGSGRLFAAVPNARSVHRQAAVLMGLLRAEDELNELDHHHGHRRVFNPESFRNAFLQAGFTLDLFGGYWLKPLSNGQMEAAWTLPMVEAFMQLGERYPDIAGEIYVVAKH